MKPKRSSASRTWCKICRVWIADNKIQREQHEQAAKHRAAATALIKEIARKNEQRGKELPKSQGIGQPGIRNRVSAGHAQAQLLESVARATAADGFRDTDPTEDEHDNALSKAEGLDENGFPLPAEAIYGQWLPAKVDDVSQDVVQDEAVKVRLDEVEKSEENVQEAESFPATLGHLATSRETEDNEVMPARQVGIASPEVNDSAANSMSRAEIEGSFKQRKVLDTRRKRKKPRSHL